MLNETFLAAILFALLPQPTRAADAPAPVPQKAQARERIYGSQLMTPEERDAYREKMRAAGSPEERERLRQQHHESMQARAKERGITLPDQPRAPARAAPKSPGPGPGAGKGPGRAASP